MSGEAQFPIETAEMAEEERADVMQSSTSDSDNSSFDDTELALQGMTMLLNNDWKSAESLFIKYRDCSPLMCSGCSFVTFLQGLMTFEEEKLAEAMRALQDTEKRCESQNGFVHSLRKKLSRKKSESTWQAEDRLTRQIIIGDSLLYQSVLTFINQDIPSYIKGGWLLRKAWKVFEKTYKEINDIHRSYNKVDSAKQNPKASEVSEDVANRLLGAISFGYGVFQLVISMVPPKVLKLIEFLGFEGDRQVGLDALHVASNSTDMKAPLATLGLLWYHTVIRPFFALDGGNVEAGVEEATILIERCEKEYPNSALFLFFKGRVQRLKSEVPAALSTYGVALEACADQREIQLICYHEIGWLHMMTLNWESALLCFSRLKEDSRWSKSYYAYLTALCQGAVGRVSEAHATMKQVPTLVKRKNNQIEAFVLKRALRFKRDPPVQDHSTLLLLEVLYLWNSLPTCPHEHLRQMLQECDKQTNKKVFHLRCLVEGTIHHFLGDDELAIQCFEEALVRHQGMKDDVHVAAYAMYELGNILSQRAGESDKGRQYFIQAKDSFKEYDFDNRLNVRIHAALKRMSNDGTPI